jgi:hypothetical protein
VESEHETVTNIDDFPDDLDTGDDPDTFDGRLAGITQLIDTFVDEINDERRIRRRAKILRLLDGLLDLARERVAEQRERIDS